MHYITNELCVSLCELWSWLLNSKKNTRAPARPPHRVLNICKLVIFSLCSLFSLNIVGSISRYGRYFWQGILTTVHVPCIIRRGCVFICIVCAIACAISFTIMRDFRNLFNLANKSFKHIEEEALVSSQIDKYTKRWHWVHSWGQVNVYPAPLDVRYHLRNRSPHTKCLSNLSHERLKVS